MTLAAEHEGGVVLFVTYLVVHIGFVVWAVSNRHAWWGVGIFLFPVIGDIAYLIYYFASKGEQGGAVVTKTWAVQEGDVVQNRVALRVTNSRDLIPRGTTLTVTRVSPQNDLVDIELPNGLRHTVYRDTLVLVRRGSPLTKPSEKAGTPSPPPAPDAASSYGEELRELASLRDEGLITEEEFTAKKRQVLGL